MDATDYEKRVWWTLSDRNVYLAGRSDNKLLSLYDSSIGARWSTDGTGNFTALANVTAYSDERLKENIEVITDALGKVCSIRGVTYNRTDTGIRQVGVIAQEVQKVLPEAVLTADDEMGTLSVAYGNMVGLLVEAIKELKAEVDDLKKKVS
jgi:hypothetical protein